MFTLNLNFITQPLLYFINIGDTCKQMEHCFSNQSRVTIVTNKIKQYVF